MQQRTTFKQRTIHTRAVALAFIRERHRRPRDVQRVALVSAVHRIEQRHGLLRQHGRNIGTIFVRHARRDGAHELTYTPDHPR